MTMTTKSVLYLTDGDELIDLVRPDDIDSITGDPFEAKVIGVEFSRRKPFAKIVTEGGTVFARKRAEAFVRTA